jgi:hypothetical protein
MLMEIGQLVAVVDQTAYDAILPTDKEGGNSRQVTAAELEKLAHQCDLTALLFDPELGLARDVPCSTQLTQSHLAEVAGTLGAYSAMPAHRHDDTVRLLAWMEHWIRWAITTCSRPGMRISSSSDHPVPIEDA